MDSVRTLSLVLRVSFMVIICINLYDNEKPGVYQTMIRPGNTIFDQRHLHTHYTVGGKCIHHQHIMDAASALREFDARFLYGNCELFIDSCVIGQMLVVCILAWDIMNCADMYIQNTYFPIYV